MASITATLGEHRSSIGTEAYQRLADALAEVPSPACLMAVLRCHTGGIDGTAYDELASAIERAQASGATFDRLAGLTVVRKTLPIEGGLEITTYEIA